MAENQRAQDVQAKTDPMAATKILPSVDEPESWSIQIDGERVTLRRMNPEGRCIESYCPVSPTLAMIYLSAVLGGYQPPMSLKHLDKHPH